MSDFYTDWLEQSKANEKAVAESPRFTRWKDLKWVRTPQDAKAALMIAPELGFTTGGSWMMPAEIPVGWHSGKHMHGEEAIYVESGEGFMALDGKRYDFGPGTVIHVPYRATHQLFNTGKVPVGYISGLAWHRKPPSTWVRWSSRKCAARTTPRRWPLFRRKNHSIGPKMDGASRCIRASM